MPSQILENLARLKGLSKPRTEDNGTSLIFNGREYTLAEFGKLLWSIPDRFPSILLLMIYYIWLQLLDAMLNIFTFALTIFNVATCSHKSREQHGNPPAFGSSQRTTLSARAPKTGTCPWTRRVPDALQHLSAQSLSGLNIQLFFFFFTDLYIYSASVLYFLGKPSDVGGCFSQIHRSPRASLWRHATQSQKVSVAPLCWSMSHIRCWSLL